MGKPKGGKQRRGNTVTGDEGKEWVKWQAKPRLKRDEIRDMIF